MPHFEIAIIDSNILSALGLQTILADMIPMAEVHTFVSFEELEAADQGQFVHYFVASRTYFEHTSYFREHKRPSIVLVNGDLQINDVPTINVCQSEQALVKSILTVHRMGHPHGVSAEKPAGHPKEMPNMPSTPNMPQGHPGHPGGMPDMSKMAEMFKDGIPPQMAEVLAKMGDSMPPKMAEALAKMGYVAPKGPSHAAPKAHPHATSRGQSHQEKDPNALSPREIEVAILLAKGLINKEIADRLNISVTTAITHRKNIMEKLHARSLADIIIHVVMNGMVDVGEL